MSAFYGNLQGARGEATRCGTADSGIKAAVRSWDGSIIASLSYNGKDELMASVSTSDYSEGTGSGCGFYGTFEEFKDLIKLHNDIKSGKVSVVRHRAKRS